ncbi:hypothetical protein AB5I41_29205 [Sphingomonas sp. MMS24-JH45]
MVVIAIIGIASAAVVLAMPDPRGRLMDEAARFATRTRAAHDTAIVDGRPGQPVGDARGLWLRPMAGGALDPGAGQAADGDALERRHPRHGAGAP